MDYVNHFVHLLILLTNLLAVVHNAPVGDEEDLINKPIIFRLEDDTCRIFVGRVEELDEIKWAHLDADMVVITGPRGSGKSELARKYALGTRKDNQTSLIWINSETHDTLFAAFRDLAALLGVDLENKGKTATIREVFQYFTDKKALFIFDNAEYDNIIINNLASFIKSPKINHVLVTSRDETWDNSKFNKIIPLNQFTKEEARNFIKLAMEKKLNLAADDATIDKLAELVGYSPLNLNMAVDFIIKENALNPGTVYTIQDHINRLENPEVTTPKIIVVTVKDITDDDVEAFLKNKVQTEAKRIEHQVSNEAKRISSQVSNEAKRFGNRVQNEAKRAEQKIRRIFG